MSIKMYLMLQAKAINCYKKNCHFHPITEKPTPKIL